MKMVRTLASPLLGVFGFALILICLPARAQNVQANSKIAGNSAENAENGKKLFVKYGCYECHGREAQGSVMTGPRLGPNPIPFEVLLAYVRKPTREMPPYTDKVVSDHDLADIYAFLKSRPRPAAVSPLLK
jgi:mono/diheme cytochrome c family protein